MEGLFLWWDFFVCDMCWPHINLLMSLCSHFASTIFPHHWQASYRFACFSGKPWPGLVWGFFMVEVENFGLSWGSIGAGNMTGCPPKLPIHSSTSRPPQSGLLIILFFSPFKAQYVHYKHVSLIVEAHDLITLPHKQLQIVAKEVKMCCREVSKSCSPYLTQPVW